MSSTELLLGRMREVAAAGSEADNNRSITAFLAKQPRPPDDLLRFFSHTSFYSVHGRDASTIAAEYFKSSSCLKYSTGNGDERQPYLTFNKTMGAEILRSALLQQRRRVEVYTAQGGTWSLERRGSPGNLQKFEEECLRDSDLSADTSPVIAAVYIRRAAAAKGGGFVMRAGCAFVEVATRAIRLSEFDDDASLSTLESLLCQQGARECVLARLPSHPTLCWGGPRRVALAAPPPPTVPTGRAPHALRVRGEEER